MGKNDYDESNSEIEEEEELEEESEEESEEKVEDKKMLNKKKKRSKTDDSQSNSEAKNSSDIEDGKSEEMIEDDDSDEEEESEDKKPKNNKKGSKSKKFKPSKKDIEDEDEEEDDSEDNENNDDQISLEEEEDKDDDDDDEEKEKKEENKKDKKQFSSGNWNEIFIKNLSYKTTEKSLAKFFQKFGEVETVKIIVDHQTNKPKGIGFCKFYEASSAEKAMAEKDNLTLDNRKLSIRFSNEEKPDNLKPVKSSNKKHSIFVANLSFNSNEVGIKNFFKDCGKILDVRIAKKNGKSRGFAHVDFDSKESMDKAMKRKNCRLDGRRLRLEIGNDPKPNTHRRQKKEKVKKSN